LGAEGLLETAAGLLLVLATIIALAWAARRYGRFSMAGKGLVNVLGGITLGSRERVVVVQVEDTRLVLGVAPGRIETLYVLDRAEDAESPFARALETEMPESRR
jgi:flagellar protein FliO/FliZ